MRLQHVSITVPEDSAGAARAFYGVLLGLEEREVPPKLDPARLIWFRVGGELELHLLLDDEPPPDKAHFCLAVGGDLEALRTRLDGAGIRTSDATEIIGRPRFFCRDPFGNLVELCRMDA